MAPVPTSRRLMMAVAIGVVAFAFWPALFAGGSLVSADIVATSPPFESYQPASFSLENGPGDPINIHAHWASLADDIRGGDFSWWNPELAAGQPTMKAGAPVFDLPYLVAPDWYAPGLVAAIRALVAIGLAFGFLRSHELHRLSALVGGIAFGLSGFMVGWMNWPHSSVAALAPGLLWAIERLIRDPRPWRAVPLGAVVALMVWSNFPSVLIYVILGATAYAAIRIVDETRRAGTPRWVLPRGAVAVVAVVIAGLLAGPHLLGFADYMDWADTSHRVGNPDDSSAGVAYLMTSVAPAIWGSDAVGPAWFGEGNWVEFNAHVGASVLLLAVFGLVSGIRSGRGRRRSFALAVVTIAALGVVIAYLGGPVAVLFGDLTGSQGGLMTRAKVLWSIGVAFGAALGVERLLDDRQAGAGRDLVATGVVLVIGSLVMVPSVLDWLDAARGAGVLRETLAVSTVPIVAALATVLLVVARVRGRASAGAAGWAMVIVVGTELLSFAMPVPTIVSREERLVATPAHDEVVQLLAPGERLAGEGRTFFPSTTQLFGIDDARGQLLKSPGYQELLRALDPAMLRRDGGGTPTYPNVPEGIDPTSPVWDALGVGVWAQFPDAVPAGIIDEPPPASGVADPSVQALHGATVVPDGGLRAVLIRVAPYVGGFVDVVVETDDGAVPFQRWVEPEDAGLLAVAILGEHLRPGSTVDISVTAPAGTLLVDLAADGSVAMGTVAGGDGLELVRTGDVLLFDRPVEPVRLVDHVVVEPEAKAAAARVAAGDHVVDRDVGLPATGGGTSELQVRSVDYDRDRITAQVVSDRPALLIVSTAHYPGWTASVDGAVADVVVADAAFLGVVVGPGEHEVVLAFRPDHLGVSAWMLVIGSVVALALLLDARRRGDLRSWPRSAG
ncbi:MAG: YfhO family protein [Acidimicrobiales bacterium]